MQDSPYECVLDIVRRVLRLDTIDVHKDFFDLAATSLSIMQIVSLVEQECGAPVSIMEAFDAGDIDSFARLAAERCGGR
ncbi:MULTISPECIES: acyl carrier protein [unclassified Streptomyces]|uniref:acyl carrier protein n=1 Tax=unclassified Streptomyces TaxID=2593676 RepID=UPI003369E1F1